MINQDEVFVITEDDILKPADKKGKAGSQTKGGGAAAKGAKSDRGRDADETMIDQTPPPRRGRGRAGNPAAAGTLSLLVSDGARLGLNEQREARAPQPRSVDQIIRALNKGRRNNSLYVKLLGSDAGAVVNGELLSSLPPSVLGVLEGDRSGGSFNPIHSATIGEWELSTEHAVAGSRTLTLTVSQN